MLFHAALTVVHQAYKVLTTCTTFPLLSVFMLLPRTARVELTYCSVRISCNTAVATTPQAVGQGHGLVTVATQSTPTPLFQSPPPPHPRF